MKSQLLLNGSEIDAKRWLRESSKASLILAAICALAVPLLHVGPLLLSWQPPASLVDLAVGFAEAWVLCTVVVGLRLYVDAHAHKT